MIRKRIVEASLACLNQRGPEPWAKEAGVTLGPNDHPEWCGLFVRTIWRRCGVLVPDWQIGSANTTYLRRRLPTEEGQPGDLVCFQGKLGHQALLVEHTSDYAFLRVVNGNGMGGVVTYTTPAIDKVLAIYDPSSLFPGKS